MRALGTTEERLGTEGPSLGVALGVQLIGTIVTATVLAIVIERFGAGLTTGVVMGLLCAAGFVATSKLADVVFSHKANTDLYFIESAQVLVSYALMGGVYGLF